MSKPLKEMITEVLKNRYEGIVDACVVDLSGLDVEKTLVLRRTLKDKSMRLEVVKNSLARRAFRGGPLEPLGDRLSGPCGLVTGGESIIDVAKVLVDLAKELGKIELKQAIVEGDPDLFSVEEVSKMKGRRELLGEVVMLASSPGRAISGCMKGAGGRIAGCLKTLADREAA